MKSKKKPIFILGMGAQKAGTSWLHKTISKERCVNFGFLKEYHVWDYVFSDLGAGFKAPLKNPDNPRAALRRLMQSSPEIYVRYFQSLIDSDVYVTGDFTPSYSMIGRSGLAEIAGTIKAAGFDLKVVYLMRDPIDRIWSAVRMDKKQKLHNGYDVDDAFCERRVTEYLGMKSHVARSDYRATVQNITKAFDQDDVFIELYENLFIRKKIGRLEDFLGLTLKHVNFSSRVNRSGEEPMSQELLHHLFDFFAPQYEFCKTNFADVNQLWRDRSTLMS